ncbi:MAG: 3-oxoacyl-ACP reductase FabG [Prevotellaceae bacterium]|nr:3-oxoacyl-ACP reductase FabG [Prevotellaceae bacterium]
MKNVLVTGGSRGIGRAISVLLARKGYHVIVNYVSNRAAADETLAQINAVGGSGELLRFDVSNLDETITALETWQNAHSDEYIEALVNNAGIRKDNLLLWMEADEWRKTLGISLDGFYNVTRPLLKPMLVKRFGRIVNMASLSGVKGLPGQCNYSASKGGLIAATKALAQEVARKGVTVNAIAPGFIKTEMVEGLDVAELAKQIPAGRFGEAEEVAELVAFLVSPQAAYITGEVIAINGGLYT